jgi:hypothetical protein
MEGVSSLSVDVETRLTIEWENSGSLYARSFFCYDDGFESSSSCLANFPMMDGKEYGSCFVPALGIPGEGRAAVSFRLKTIPSIFSVRQCNYFLS